MGRCYCAKRLHQQSRSRRSVEPCGGVCSRKIDGELLFVFSLGTFRPIPPAPFREEGGDRHGLQRSRQPAAIFRGGLRAGRLRLPCRTPCGNRPHSGASAPKVGCVRRRVWAGRTQPLGVAPVVGGTAPSRWAWPRWWVLLRLCFVQPPARAARRILYLLSSCAAAIYLATAGSALSSPAKRGDLSRLACVQASPPAALSGSARAGSTCCRSCGRCSAGS